MASYNKVILMGNLTRDPELKHLASGSPVCDLGLAVNEKYKSKDGEAKESVTFVDITVWGRQAESCAEYLSKGSPVLVEGSLKLDQWETEDGDKRSKLKVNGQNVQFLGSPKARDSQRSESAPSNDNTDDGVPNF